MNKVFLILGITVFLFSCDNTATEEVVTEEVVVVEEEVSTVVEETVTTDTTLVEVAPVEEVVEVVE